MTVIWCDTRSKVPPVAFRDLRRSNSGTHACAKLVIWCLINEVSEPARATIEGTEEVIVPETQFC